MVVTELLVLRRKRFPFKFLASRSIIYAKNEPGLKMTWSHGKKKKAASVQKRLAGAAKIPPFALLANCLSPTHTTPHLSPSFSAVKRPLLALLAKLL